MAGYIGPAPVPQATQNREAFTATSGQTSFATAGYTPQFIDVYLNGVKLAAADYTATNGSDVVLASGAASGDILEVVAFSAFTVADQTFTGTTTAANLTVTGAFTSQGIDDNANAVAITIDSSENVGIGISTPSAKLEVKAADLGGTAGDSEESLRLTTLNTNADKLVFTNERLSTGTTWLSAAHRIQRVVDVAKMGYIQFGSRETDLITFGEGTTERMRIDGDGNIGIGVVPETWNSANNGLQVGPRAAIFGTDSGYSGFSNNQYQATDGSAKYIVTAPAAIINLDPDSTIKFRQAASGTADTAISWSEAMRIDSSGNLLVGTTLSPTSLNSTSSEEGMAIGGDGLVVIANDGQSPLVLNRLSSDGNILNFNKDGASVGSIGVVAGDNLYIGSTTSGHAGIGFGSNEWTPMSPVGTNADNTVNIGASSRRIKNIYLSGGVYLGGTGSANKLDDYEEGTWTPSMAGYSGVTYGTRVGYYTKVGRMIMANFKMDISSIGTYAGNSHIGGLPFSAGISTTPACGVQLTVMTALNETRDEHYVAIYNGGSSIFIYNRNGTARNGNVHQAGTYAGTLIYMTT